MPYGFRGHFLDLRTLAFVLTDRGHSLDSACKAFGVEQRKITVERHGVVTPITSTITAKMWRLTVWACVQAAGRVRPLRRGPARDASVFAGLAWEKRICAKWK